MTTKIEWTDETWNPVTGCTKVSQGCKHCYAERLWPKVSAAEAKRLGMAKPRPFTTVGWHPDRLLAPLRWTTGKRVFVNSMSDLFHEHVPFDVIDQVFSVMACTTRHQYQVLTKRPLRMLEYFNQLEDESGGGRWDEQPRPGREWFWPRQIQPLKVWPQWTPYVEGKRGGYDNCGPIYPLENVWLGVSVEDQETANERIPLLLQTPAAVRFLSCEPLLGPVDATRIELDGGPFDALRGGDVGRSARVATWPRVDWVISGGESGPKARPSHPDWHRSIRDQCEAAGVPFLFKQWGEWAPDNCQGPNVWQHLERKRARWTGLAFEIEPADAGWPDDDNLLFRLGKKASGRTLDGRTHDEYPA